MFSLVGVEWNSMKKRRRIFYLVSIERRKKKGRVKFQKMERRLEGENNRENCDGIWEKEEKTREKWNEREWSVYKWKGGIKKVSGLFLII